MVVGDWWLGTVDWRLLAGDRWLETGGWELVAAGSGARAWLADRLEVGKLAVWLLACLVVWLGLGFRLIWLGQCLVIGDSAG